MLITSERFGTATSSESWVAPDRQVLAYVATDDVGAAAEARGLLPFDPYDVPRGVLDFYRKATAAERRCDSNQRTDGPLVGESRLR